MYKIFSHLPSGIYQWDDVSNGSDDWAGRKYELPSGYRIHHNIAYATTSRDVKNYESAILRVGDNRTNANIDYATTSPYVKSYESAILRVGDNRANREVCPIMRYYGVFGWLVAPLRAVVESRLANQRLRCTAAGGENMPVCLLRGSHFVYNGYS